MHVTTWHRYGDMAPQR